MRDRTASGRGGDSNAVELAESPFWDARSQCLVWVDIPHGRVHSIDRRLELSTVEVGQPVGAVAPREGGGLVLAVRDGFGVIDAGAAEMRVAALVEVDDTMTRMNDGACDARGRFSAETMAYDSTPRQGRPRTPAAGRLSTHDWTRLPPVRRCAPPCTTSRRSGGSCSS